MYYKCNNVKYRGSDSGVRMFFDFYENGEIIETRDVILEIAAAIHKWEDSEYGVEPYCPLCGERIRRWTSTKNARVEKLKPFNEEGTNGGNLVTVKQKKHGHLQSVFYYFILAKIAAAYIAQK